MDQVCDHVKETQKMVQNADISVALCTYGEEG
jgi:hypothetical protein